MDYENKTNDELWDMAEYLHDYCQFRDCRPEECIFSIEEGPTCRCALRCNPTLWEIDEVRR